MATTQLRRPAGAGGALRHHLLADPLDLARDLLLHHPRGAGDGLPVLAFDLGAQGEAVRRRSRPGRPAVYFRCRTDAAMRIAILAAVLARSRRRGVRRTMSTVSGFDPRPAGARRRGAAPRHDGRLGRHCRARHRIEAPASLKWTQYEHSLSSAPSPTRSRATASPPGSAATAPSARTCRSGGRTTRLTGSRPVPPSTSATGCSTLANGFAGAEELSRYRFEPGEGPPTRAQDHHDRQRRLDRPRRPCPRRGDDRRRRDRRRQARW